MATKKNNTKKANNKPETKEEIVEIKEKEIIEELVELTDEEIDALNAQEAEEITNFLKNKGMDDEFINNVLNNEELEETVKAIMEAEQNKPSLKERAKKFASDKKEAIQNAAIVVGATAAICGVVYAVCNVADDDDEHEEEMVKATIYLDIPETESKEITEIEEPVMDSEEITEAEEA